MTTSLALGLDVGSTTVKAVVVDSHGQIVFSDYRRHHADVRGELAKLLRDVGAAFPNGLVKVAMTGSGGLGVAKIMGVQFIQEVISATNAIERLNREIRRRTRVVGTFPDGKSATKAAYRKSRSP